MRFGCAGLLTGCLCAVAAGAPTTGFIREVPGLLKAKLLATNEVAGTFVQTKTDPDGRAFVSRGVYRIRPGVDFAWRTVEPFDALFWADRRTYVYSNEDECVTRPLKDLRGFSHFAAVGEGDFAPFLQAFDARYKEEEGVFHVLAKPKERRLAKFLSRVEADGLVSNWVLKATFPDGTVFEVKCRDN
ncbi:MAG: outer membrane lipoprotein carrier protein LolA [Kiritimatiellia bacterium]